MSEGMLRQLTRRISMMLGTGKITAHKDTGGIQQLQYQTPLEVRGDTPRMAEFGFSSGLPLGTDVVLAFLGGDRSSAVIIASNNQQYRQTGLNPGDTMIYNQWGMVVRLTEAGIMIEAAGKPVSINGATTVTVKATASVRLETKDLLVTGDITDHCDVSRVTLKTLREAYNRHQHVVSEVKSGSDSKTSERPGDIVQ